MTTCPNPLRLHRFENCVDLLHFQILNNAVDVLIVFAEVYCCPHTGIHESLPNSLIDWEHVKRRHVKSSTGIFKNFCLQYQVGFDLCAETLWTLFWQATGVNRARAGELEHPNKEKVTSTLPVRAGSKMHNIKRECVEWRTTREGAKRFCELDRSSGQILPGLVVNCFLVSLS